MPAKTTASTSSGGTSGSVRRGPQPIQPNGEYHRASPANSAASTPSTAHGTMLRQPPVRRGRGQAHTAMVSTATAAGQNQSSPPFGDTSSAPNMRDSIDSPGGP